MKIKVWAIVCNTQVRCIAVIYGDFNTVLSVLAAISSLCNHRKQRISVPPPAPNQYHDRHANCRHQLLPSLFSVIVIMETATQIDYLKEYSNNIWFVLGAYFFAFFPWSIMNNIDFVSEKWRTCRRTRKLAHIHVASSIFPIIYVAVYAEAQRRDGDNKEFGAALAAVTFNLFQLLRTIMGLVQLNAFVAWCKHAVESIRVLEGQDDQRSDRGERAGRNQTSAMETVLQWQNMFVSWCKSGSQRIGAFVRMGRENGEHRRNGDEESSQLSVNTRVDGINGENMEAVEATVENR